MAGHRLLRRAPHSAVGMVGRRAFNAMAAQPHRCATELERGTGHSHRLARERRDAGKRRLMARWLVDIIGKKLQHVGTVDADNEREALAEAIKRFDVRPALRSKIA